MLFKDSVLVITGFISKSMDVLLNVSVRWYTVFMKSARVCVVSESLNVVFSCPLVVSFAYKSGNGQFVIKPLKAQIPPHRLLNSLRWSDVTYCSPVCPSSKHLCLFLRFTDLSGI